MKTTALAIALAAIMAVVGVVSVFGDDVSATGEDLEGYGSVNEIDIIPGYSWQYTSRFAADLTRAWH